MNEWFLCSRGYVLFWFFMAVSANGKMERKCHRFSVDAELHMPCSEFFLRLFPWCDCSSLQLFVNGSDSGARGMACCKVQRAWSSWALRLHKSCLVATEGMQALKEGISGSLFLSRQLRGYLEFLVGVHKEELDLEFFKSLQSTVSPSSAVYDQSRSSEEECLNHHKRKLISTTSGHFSLANV